MKKILVVVGSKSDLPLLTEVKQLLKKEHISFSTSIISCHRNLDKLVNELNPDHLQDIGVIIAIANAVSNLPAIIAGYLRETSISVIGIGLDNKGMGGIESLLAINTIPKGVPLLNTGIGKVGLHNAALSAVKIIKSNNN